MRGSGPRQLGSDIGAVHNWVRTYREGGMATPQRNRNAGTATMTRRRCAAGPRNRNRGNALTREVAEVRRKRPGRRPAAPAEQREDAAGRPSAPGVFARLDDMPARHRAGRPPLSPRQARGRQTRRSAHPGGRGVRSLQEPVRVAESRPCSKPASRRRRSVRSWPRTGLSRMCPDDAGTAHTRARRLRRPATSPTAILPPKRRTRNGPRISPGIKARDGKAHLFPMIDCHDGMDRRVHGRIRPQLGARQQDASQGRGITARGRSPWCVPTADATAGGPDGRISWNGTV